MELPDLGDHCQLEECGRLDFLPIRCSWCGGIFCGDHYLCSRHSCRERDEHQVPVCPLCNQPVPLGPHHSPDLAVSEHMDRNCATQRERLFTNRCSLARCRARELVALRCDRCGRNHCIAHRHPADHQCPGTPPASAGKLPGLLDSLAQRGASALGQLGARHGASPACTAAAVRSLQGEVSEEEALRLALEQSVQPPSRRTRPPADKANCHLC